MTKRDFQVTVQNPPDVFRTFGQTGRTVPPRTGPGRRQKQHKELYCLHKYVLTLARNDLLAYPLTVTMGESPDFMLSDPIDGQHGLEVTEATTKKFQRELTLSELSGDEVELLDGDGWAGDSPEHEWCAAILRAINRKAWKIRNRSFRRATRHDLLVYVSTRGGEPVLNFDAARPIMQRKIRRWSSHWTKHSNLGIISITDGKRLIYDAAGSFSVFPCQ